MTRKGLEDALKHTKIRVSLYKNIISPKQLLNVSNVITFAEVARLVAEIWHVS